MGKKIEIFICLLVSVFLAACSGESGQQKLASASSTTGSTNVSEEVPSAPTNLIASAGNKQVVISWSSVTGASSYNIYWGTASGVTKTSGTKIQSASSPYTHSSLTNATTYYYVVTASNSSGESAVSTEYSITPTAGSLSTTPASLSISAGPIVLDMLAISTISATVMDANGEMVVDGTDVSFGLSDTTLGSLSAASTTTVNGVASIIFTALSKAGTAVITAVAGSASNSVNVEIEVTAGSITGMSASPANLTVLGTASVSLTVLDVAGNVVPDGTTVNFKIVGAGDMEVSMGAIPSKAVTVDGLASTTFTASNLPGRVTITATVGSVTGSVSIPVNAAITRSIEFVAASPSVIGIEGSGQPETSDFSFLVRDANGNAVIDGIEVSFGITGPGGGESLSSDTASTVDGIAKVTIKSGTVAGPVRILATVVGVTPEVSTSSTGASIGGGRPSGTHFDLAASIINLPGLAYKNVETTITAFLADRFGNFNVLKGTSISFYTEAGAVDRSDITESTGLAAVKFRTQLPDPLDTIPQDGTVGGEPNWGEGSYGSGFMFNPRDGWVTVLSTTKGEEAFTDDNANGVHDFTDTNGNGIQDYTDTNANGVHDPGEAGEGEAWIDIGEPFIDKNDNGVRDDGSGADGIFEEFIDANLNSVYDGPNGLWDIDIMIFQSIKLVFSSAPAFDNMSPAGAWTRNLTRIERNDYDPADPGTSPYDYFTIADGGCLGFTIYIADINQNRISPGSTVAITAVTGKLTGGTTAIIADGLSFGPSVMGVALCDETPNDTITDPNDPDATIPGPPEATSIDVAVSWNTPDGELTYTISIFGEVD